MRVQCHDTRYEIQVCFVGPCSESRQAAFLPIVNIFAKSYMRVRATSYLDLGEGESRVRGRGGFHLDDR